LKWHCKKLQGNKHAGFASVEQFNTAVQIRDVGLGSGSTE